MMGKNDNPFYPCLKACWKNASGTVDLGNAPNQKARGLEQRIE